jgi:hypothetical protein
VQLAGEKWEIHKILFGKLEGKRSLGRPRMIILK